MDSKPAVPATAVSAIAEAEDRARNVVDPASADLMARSNAISVSVEDIHLASAEIHKLAVEERHGQGRTDCLLQLFRGQRDKAFVVNARLEAMARLVRAGKVPCWVLPAGADGVHMIADPVFLAAAKVPLLFMEKESYFEPVAFVALVLANATVYGHA